MLRPLLVACIVLVIGAAPARATELPRYGGLYTAANQPLPMLDSKIWVNVRGPIIEVVVTQRFTNRTDQAIEATYVFPLPPDAAVSAMSIKAGTKTIRGAIAKRDEAQRRYEEAVRAGVTAALTDQERPDVFTQTVAGIAPRSTVEITLRYDAMAHFYDGAWGFAVPMVVAPRYVPGVATARPTTGTGRAPDTDRAPDASRVTPAGAPGAGGATQVSIRFADKVWDVTSPTHELAVAGQHATFTDPRSDHDAVIRWRAAPASGWVEHGPEGGFAAVVVGATAVPPRKGALRCLLVLDRSATSRGDADAIAQPLVRQLLGGLSAADRIAVTGSDALGWSPPADVLRALDQSWHKATGAFDLTRVLLAARPDGAPIVIVTSALVADDRAALAAARTLGVPIHVIGVGPAPARGLLTQLATATGGTVRFAVPGDDLPAIARAVVADAASPPPPLAVSWGTLAARDVVPGAMPRLGTGQAMLVLARVDRATTANGRAAGAVFAIEPLAAAPAITGSITPVGPLARRWARSRLDELLAAPRPADRTAVTELALKFGLVSPYTSMIAIGEDVVVEGGTRRSVAVPVSVPSGMKWQQVKKEITVEVSGTTRVDNDRDGERDVTRAGKRQPARQPIAAGPAPTHPDPAPRAEKPVAQEDSDDEADYESAPRDAPSPQTALGTDASAEEIEIMAMAPPLLGGRTRLTLGFGGGLVRAGGESAGLVTLGTRLEVGRRAMFGADLSLWLLDGDAQGRVLLSFAARGVARWLELGGGVGAHLGAGYGPAGSLSLRVHVPPIPRAAGYLRYDAAYLVDGEARAAQHGLTLGLEWGF